MSDTWLALAIGNSRLHWARFIGDRLQDTWDTSHGKNSARTQGEEAWEIDRNSGLPVPIVIASVVAEQTQQWKSHPNVRFLTLEDVPLQGTYPTLGIDRALVAWGAIQTIGSPVLVIDAGTALTFTGVDGDLTLVGGAILPGLRLQFEALGQKTSALPVVSLEHADLTPLPLRWARQTEAAIASGILYTLMAGIQGFIEDWQQQFPHSAVVMTGGDSNLLYHLLQQQHPNFSQLIIPAPHLIFQGMKDLRIGH